MSMRKGTWWAVHLDMMGEKRSEDSGLELGRHPDCDD